MQDLTIFISYRRSDSAPYARLLYDGLRTRFGRENLFMDVDNIFAGEDWVEAIERAIARADVVLAVIGNEWVDARDEHGRRLDNELDRVRLELEAAFRLNKRVIPVLIETASMPAKADLPESLRPLLHKQGTRIAHATFKPDLAELVADLRKFQKQRASAAIAQAEAARLAAETEAAEAARQAEAAHRAENDRVVAAAEAERQAEAARQAEQDRLVAAAEAERQAEAARQAEQDRLVAAAEAARRSEAARAAAMAAVPASAPAEVSGPAVSTNFGGRTAPELVRPLTSGPSRRRKAGDAVDTDNNRERERLAGGAGHDDTGSRRFVVGAVAVLAIAVLAVAALFGLGMVRWPVGAATAPSPTAAKTAAGPPATAGDTATAGATGATEITRSPPPATGEHHPEPAGECGSMVSNDALPGARITTEIAAVRGSFKEYIFEFTVLNNTSAQIKPSILSEPPLNWSVQTLINGQPADSISIGAHAFAGFLAVVTPPPDVEPALYTIDFMIDYAELLDRCAVAVDVPLDSSSDLVADPFLGSYPYCYPPGTDIESVTENVPTSLDPTTVGDWYARRSLRTMYESLLAPAGDPMLATDYTALAPPFFGTVRLREGIRFANDSPMDASDVVSSFTRLRIGGRALFDAEWSISVAEVSEPSDNWIEVQFQPWPGDWVSRVLIVPDDVSSTSLERSAFGTGPYRSIQFIPGQSLGLEVNPDYWGQACEP